MIDPATAPAWRKLTKNGTGPWTTTWRKLKNNHAAVADVAVADVVVADVDITCQAGRTRSTCPDLCKVLSAHLAKSKKVKKVLHLWLQTLNGNE